MAYSISITAVERTRKQGFTVHWSLMDGSVTPAVAIESGTVGLVFIPAGTVDADGNAIDPATYYRSQLEAVFDAQLAQVRAGDNQFPTIQKALNGASYTGS